MELNYKKLRKISFSYSLFHIRAFAAWEEKIEVDVDAEDRHRATLDEYQEKLVIGETRVPDPLSLDAKSWISETKGGIEKWPSVYYHDISNLLHQMNTSKDLIHRLDCRV